MNTGESTEATRTVERGEPAVVLVLHQSRLDSLRETKEVHSLHEALSRITGKLCLRSFSPYGPLSSSPHKEVWEYYIAYTMATPAPLCLRSTVDICYIRAHGRAHLYCSHGSRGPSEYHRSAHFSIFTLVDRYI